jgi:hypothetical protein
MEVIRYIPKVTEFFYEHPEIFKKANSGWAKITEDVKKRTGNHVLHPFYGKCFPMSEFMNLYLGPSAQLKCLRGKQLVDEITTTHWFVVMDNTIYDISGEQFDTFYPMTQDDYAKAKNAAFGLRRFSWNGCKSKEYPTVVPSRVTMNFAEAMRDDGIDIKGLNWWLDEWLAHKAECDAS